MRRELTDEEKMNIEQHCSEYGGGGGPHICYAKECNNPVYEKRHGSVYKPLECAGLALTIDMEIGHDIIVELIDEEDGDHQRYVSDGSCICSVESEMEYDEHFALCKGCMNKIRTILGLEPLKENENDFD